MKTSSSTLKKGLPGHSRLQQGGVSKLHGCCRCCITYLQVLIKPEIMPQGDAPPSLELAPGFKAPVPTDYAGMKEYIETALPAESPIMYGMHTNAELSLLTSQVISHYLQVVNAQTVVAGSAKQ